MSKNDGSNPSRFGLVPLADRILWSSLLRLALAGAAAGIWFAVPSERTGPQSLLAVVGIGFLISIPLAPMSINRSRRLAIAGSSFNLLFDGVFLGILLSALGGIDGPVPFLMVIHVASVSLLMTFRSGVRVAMWHSLVVLCVVELDRAGFFTGEPTPGNFPYSHYSIFLTMIWLTAILTSTFAAINERELRRRRYDAEVLNRLAAALEPAREPEEVARLLASTVTEQLVAGRALVILQPTTDVRTFPAFAALVAADGTTAEPAVTAAVGDDSVLRAARESTEPVLKKTLNPVTDPWLAEHLPDARNLLIFSIPLDKTADGWLVIEVSRGLRRGRVERSMLSAGGQAAAHTGLALTRAATLRALHDAAATDGLTGVANRRTFDTMMARELGQAGRSGTQVGVALVDLDHFKQVNDTHGHLIGDEVLRTAARALSQSSRAVDVVARYGGEEFAVILPGVDLDAVAHIGERLRLAVRGADGVVPVTCSIGIAVSRPGATVPELLANADRSLYQAKQAGRDRCIVDGIVDGLDEPVLV